MKLLAKTHEGMRVDADHILTGNGVGFKAFRSKLNEHLKELATRYYAGDITIVDEFLQLYCIGEDERAKRAEIEKEAGDD